MSNRIGDSLFHFGPNEHLVRSFAASGVRFVLVGGLAISWYCPERIPDDMDLLVQPSIQNSGRVATALNAIGISGLPEKSFSTLGLQVPLKVAFYAELLTPRVDAEPFEEVESRATMAKLFRIPIHIASVADLITMKRAAAMESGANPKHEKDIGMLFAYRAKLADSADI